MSFTGEKEVMDRLAKLIQNLKNGSIEGLNKASDAIIKTAIPLTPLDKGPLRAGYKKRRKTEGDTISLAIINDAYDDETNEYYAADQHENLEYRHTHGQAKFLTTAVKLEESNILNTIVSEIKKNASK
jgi:hypothetical protein